MFGCRARSSSWHTTRWRHYNFTLVATRWYTVYYCLLTLIYFASAEKECWSICLSISLSPELFASISYSEVVESLSQLLLLPYTYGCFRWFQSTCERDLSMFFNTGVWSQLGQWMKIKVKGRNEVWKAQEDLVKHFWKAKLLDQLSTLNLDLLQHL